MFKFSKLMLLGMLAFTMVLAGCGASLEKASQLQAEGKDKEALEMAGSYLNSEKPDEQIQAIRIITRVGGNDAGKLITPKIRSSNANVQLQAIKSVGELRYEPASTDLVEVTPSVKGENFDATATSIKKIGSAAGDRLTTAYHNAGQGNDRTQYKKMIMKVGASLTDSIVKALKGKSYFDNRDNFEILIAFQNPKVAGIMIGYLSNEEVAHSVSEAIVKLGSMSVTPAIKALEANVKRDEDTSVRERLIKILGELQSERALPILEKLSQDPSDQIRIAADDALRKIRNF